MMERNGLPSFSVSNTQDDASTFTLESEETERFMSEHQDLDKIISLLSYNATYVELLDQLVAKVDAAIAQNRAAQAAIRSQLSSASTTGGTQKQRQITNALPCWPPYFKDSIGMMPNSNVEALEIARICSADPLIEEERKWNPRELEQLPISVSDSLKDDQIVLLESRKELYLSKLAKVGIETTEEQKTEWREEIARLKRKIAYIRNRPKEEFLAENTDYSRVDWAKISARDFQGARTIAQLRQRWCNDVAPFYNTNDWTFEEDSNMMDLARDISDWSIIAQMLGTGRSPFRCFERIVYLRQSEREPRPWTPEEDMKLRQMVLMHKVGDEIPWAKVAVFMDGRDKTSCEYRYTRTLWDKLRHGRWTEPEDMLLLEAVNKYGPQNWGRISACVDGRSAIQCRDRWVHVLDHKRRNLPWGWEEYMRLLHGVRFFGRDECARIAKMIPGRNNMDVRMRIRLLVNCQIKQKERGNIVLRHFAHNYLHFKTRRKNVVDDFNKYLEAKQSDARQQFVSRLGLGSFVATPNTGLSLDYTNIKKERAEEFNDLKIVGSGRWVKSQKYKNPNEYDWEDLMNELDLLPDNIREEAISWLEESDKRLEAEREQEKEIPEDTAEAKQYYERLFPQERLDELFEMVTELLPPRQSDFDYFEKHRRRVPKIRIKTLKQPKPKRVHKKRQNRKKKSKLVKLLENIDNLSENQVEGMRYMDRMMVEIFRDVEQMPMEEKRSHLIGKLCTIIRQRVGLAAANKYKNDFALKEVAFNSMLDFVRQVVEDPAVPIPVRPVVNAVNLPVGWENMSMRELIRLKISPELLLALAQRASQNVASTIQSAASSPQPSPLPASSPSPLQNKASSTSNGIGDGTMELDQEPTSIGIGHRVRKRRISGDSNRLNLKNTVFMPEDKCLYTEEIPSEQSMFTMERIMSKLLPPNPATMNAVEIYDRKVRIQFQREVELYRQRMANLFVQHQQEYLPPEIFACQPGTSAFQATEFFVEPPADVVTDEIRSSKEYALLKKRMYRLFYIPMAMTKALRQMEADSAVAQMKNNSAADVQIQINNDDGYKNGGPEVEMEDIQPTVDPPVNQPTLEEPQSTVNPQPTLDLDEQEPPTSQPGPGS